MPSARDTRTRRQKLEDMARLGTPAEQEAARLAIARIDRANPMAAPPRERPPVVEIRFGNGETVRVESWEMHLAGNMRPASARRWSMPPPSGEEWTEERARDDRQRWAEAFRRMEDQLRDTQEKARAFEENVRKFADDVEQQQARWTDGGGPTPGR